MGKNKRRKKKTLKQFFYNPGITQKINFGKQLRSVWECVLSVKETKENEENMWIL